MGKLKLGVISLGCPKNRVDTELILGSLSKLDLEITNREEEADIILINTCGFIESAKQESIDTILEMAELKKSGKLKTLIVCGCLSGRYQKELETELPEVDAFLGVNAYDEICDAVLETQKGLKFSSYSKPKVEGDYLNRVITTPSYMAYVKISEGCNNRCTYCAIPYIRGNQQSRTIEDIKAEVVNLLSMGVKEVVLVAQDTTRYGWDLKNGTNLATLMDTLASLPGLELLRVLYCYPEAVTKELLEVMNRHDNIAKYIDIPIQHLNDGILKRMNRKNTASSTRNVVQMIRSMNPDFIVRTTVITGFPGETEEMFNELLDGIRELKFDRLGAFAYSEEEGTPAAGYDDQIPIAVREERQSKLMEIQNEISLECNKKRIGTKVCVRVDGIDQLGMYYGRSYAEVYDIDGCIYISSDRELTIGETYQVQIRQADSYDLMGDIIE